MGRRTLHIGITSVLFDHKPEGTCTGRLVRALLEGGHRVTLMTSTKEHSDLVHPRLRKVVVGHRPRFPRFLFRTLARLEGEIYSNFYTWARGVAKLDLGDDLPDLFYGRAWPFGSLVPAYRLAQRYGRPLVLHFSDPFPSPGGSPPGAAFLRNLQMMIDSASALTFTNDETIPFQQSFTPFDEHRAFVLNHIGPEPVVFGEPGQPQHFYHLGSVGPHRPALPLLEGFAIYHRKNPGSRLFFVGNVEKHLRPQIKKLGISDFVELLPFTRDVKSIMRRAGVLVAIDAPVTVALYTPTKIVEYLRTDRPVLAVTPVASPVAHLMARSPQTAVAVTEYGVEAIASAFARAAEIPFKPDAFAERIRKMSDFDGAAVLRRFEALAHFCLGSEREPRPASGAAGIQSPA